jgi:hypothetical protein
MTVISSCPFCGGPAEMDTRRLYRNFRTGAVEDACAIYCLECCAEQSFCYRDEPGVDRDTIIADVVARWNTRSEADARMQRAAEALKPFAEACAHLHPSQPDDGVTLDGFKVADFRRAAEVYAALFQEGGGNSP